MSEIRCKECGAIIPEGVKECTNCGCPIEYSVDDVNTSKDDVNTEKDKHINTMTSWRKNIFSLISLVIGCVIIICGIVVLNHHIDVDTHKPNNYDVDSAAFGGDFYTEIYNASDTIVDELNEINDGTSVMANSLYEITKSIYYIGGWIIISIGLGTVAFSLLKFANMKK